MKYNYPKYKLKMEFTPGTWGENDWKLGEQACVDRAFYVLPGGTEYAIFKFVERTRTGRKKYVGKRGTTEDFPIIISIALTKRRDGLIVIYRLMGCRERADVQSL